MKDYAERTVVLACALVFSVGAVTLVRLFAPRNTPERYPPFVQEPEARQPEYPLASDGHSSAEPDHGPDAANTAEAAPVGESPAPDPEEPPTQPSLPMLTKEALAAERELQARTETLLASYTLEPWSAWEELNQESIFAALPTESDVKAAGASLKVREALDRVMKAEELRGKLFAAQAPQLEQANAQRAVMTLREALMAEMEKATGFPYWRKNEAIFQAAVEGLREE